MSARQLTSRFTFAVAGAARIHLHNARATLVDYRQVGDELWGRVVTEIETETGMRG
jgi:hypothetical protein